MAGAGVGRDAIGSERPSPPFLLAEGRRASPPRLPRHRPDPRHRPPMPPPDVSRPLPQIPTPLPSVSIPSLLPYFSPFFLLTTRSAVTVTVPPPPPYLSQWHAAAMSCCAKKTSRNSVFLSEQVFLSPPLPSLPRPAALSLPRTQRCLSDSYNHAAGPGDDAAAADPYVLPRARSRGSSCYPSRARHPNGV